MIWPDQPEFIRMAARFGATIVPFGVVGEDDIAQVCLCCLTYIFLCNIRRNNDAFWFLDIISLKSFGHVSVS